MSHNPYATQPPDVRAAWNRACGCPTNPHHHGCENRYRAGCKCPDCMRGATYARRRRHRTLVSECRRQGIPYPPPRKTEVDWVNVERLLAGQPTHNPTIAEVDSAIIWLTDHGYSARQIRLRFPIPITHRRVTRARARRRARLEVAA